jgi:hypothetical protein
MQTLTLQVQDNFLSQFLSMIGNHKNEITIKKDKNLELDPYFYERQKQLQQDIDEIDSGKAEMISHSELWNNINNHLKTIQN